MAFFGFKSKKEVEQEKAEARQQGERQAIQQNYANLSNLSKGSQINFAIPYFDVFDPRLMDTGVPVAVHGTIAYAIEDMDLFQSINKTEGFSDETFQQKLRSTVTKYIKGVVSNAPSDAQIPVVQLERKIMELSDIVQNKVAPQVERLFGIKVRNLDITSIHVDKDSRGYRELKALTADLEKENLMAKHNANLSNFNLQNELNQDTLKAQSALNIDALQRQQELNLGGQEELQRMQLENQRETLRIQREEMQRASRLQTEQTFLGAHQANLNAGTVNNALDNGFNAFKQQPMMGGGSLLGMGAPAMPGMKATAPQVSYMLAVNKQQAGPFDWNQLQQLAQQGKLTRQTYVWTQGMQNWELAGNVQELQPLFASAVPQMPGMPPMPGM
jgi:membrane protease subunit (stomatin/prohibitin family)